MIKLKLHICSKTSLGKVPEDEDNVTGMTEKSSLSWNWLQ
jgi:hypothetical protein